MEIHFNTPSGYGIATVNSAVEGVLIDKLHIVQLPSIVVLLDGRLIHYKEQHIDSNSVLNFARHSIPPHYVTNLSDRQNYQSFLEASIEKNKAGVLVFGPNEQPPLRYI